MASNGKHGQKNQIKYFPNYHQLRFATITTSNISMHTSVTCAVLSKYHFRFHISIHRNQSLLFYN